MHRVLSKLSQIWGEWGIDFGHDTYGRTSVAQFKKLFWKAANKTNFNEFHNILAEIKGLNMQAYDYLMGIDVKHWSRCKFDHTPTAILTQTTIPSLLTDGWIVYDTVHQFSSLKVCTNNILNSRTQDMSYPKDIKKNCPRK